MAIANPLSAAKAKVAPRPKAGPPPLDMPYAGLLRNDVPKAGPLFDETNVGRQRGEVALTAPHTLVSGRTSSGKTRTCLAPNIVLWGSRPVVALSSKGDLAELTIRQRARYGPVYLMDLSGEVRASELKGVDVTPVVSDPCALIDDDDSALDMAALLLEVGALGGGDGSGGGGDSFWSTLAMRPLAAILRAAGWYYSPDDGSPVWGGGISWALAACEDSGADLAAKPKKKKKKKKAEPDSDAEDADGGEDDDGGEDEAEEPIDHTTPNWDTAVIRCAIQECWHADSLRAAKKLDPAQRDSIGVNARVALSAWAKRAVAGQPDATAFNPAMLEAPGASLYIVSPMTGAAAPAASAVLTSIVDHWRKRVGLLDAALFVLDELPNGAPLPRLANWVGEARGLGIRLVVGVQASSQFEPKWGSAGLKILRDIFPSVLILPGAPEKELCEAAAWAMPLDERGTSSNDASGKASQSHEKYETIAGQELLPPTRQPNARQAGRLLISGRQGVLVDLPDISEMM